MKKLLIALAAVTTIAAGASTAQAKVNFDVYIGGYGNGHGHGYGHGYTPYYEPVGYYTRQCHFVKVKVVSWYYGERVVSWKKKKVCNKVYVGY